MEKIYLRWYVCSAQLRYFLMFNLRILYLKYFRDDSDGGWNSSTMMLQVKIDIFIFIS